MCLSLLFHLPYVGFVKGENSKNVNLLNEGLSLVVELFKNSKDL